MNNQVLKAVEFKRFNRIGNEATIEFIIENIHMASCIELFNEERIVYLPVRWGKLYHKCDEEEWEKLQGHLVLQNIPIIKNKWWKFWA